MAKERGDVHFVHAAMYYPVTDAAMDTGSYEEFADGTFFHAQGDGVVLGRLHRRPGATLADHTSPNEATIEQLSGRPLTLLLVDEADVLRDEGEAYAPNHGGRRPGHDRPLRRHPPRLHDAQPAQPDQRDTGAAIAQAIAFFRQAFGTD
jgi:acetyl esterase